MGQKIKCTITEERLARLVSESIEEVLLEAQNDEGLGGFLGKLAGKVRNGVNKFRDDFNAQRNGQLYQNRDYDGYTANGVDPNARNFDKTMSQNYRSALQKGASAAAPGSFTTPYGDSVGGGRENGGNGGNRGNGGNNDVLQQMQQMLAALTQQMQSLMQNGGSTGGAQGSTGGAQGSTGGAQGSTGGAQGSTGGAQGSTGGAQDSQGIIDRQRKTQNATKSRNLSPDDYKVTDGKTSTAAQNDAELHKGTNPDNPYADLEESRKRQLSGKALMEIIAKTIKKHLYEGLEETSFDVAQRAYQKASDPNRVPSAAMQRRLAKNPSAMAQQNIALKQGASNSFNREYGHNLANVPYGSGDDSEMTVADPTKPAYGGSNLWAPGRDIFRTQIIGPDGEPQQEKTRTQSAYTKFGAEQGDEDEAKPGLDTGGIGGMIKNPGLSRAVKRGEAALDKSIQRKDDLG